MKRYLFHLQVFIFHFYFHTNYGKGKGKLGPCPHHESIQDRRSTVLLIIDLGARWKWVVNITPQPLYPWGI